MTHAVAEIGSYIRQNHRLVAVRMQTRRAQRSPGTKGYFESATLGLRVTFWRAFGITYAPSAPNLLPGPRIFGRANTVNANPAALLVVLVP